MKCGRETADEREVFCTECRKTPRAFDAGRCTFNYHSAVEKAIIMLKEEGTCEFVDFFARAAFERHEDFLRTIGADAIVPVPLHRGRLRRRGFNQAGLFAESLSDLTGIPVDGLLAKKRMTKDQKGLNRWQRETNLREAFEVVRKDRIPETVLLTDDIFTTGSTVDSCAKALKASGVKRVYFICIAAGTADS